jgi:hypothetical protein
MKKENNKELHEEQMEKIQEISQETPQKQEMSQFWDYYNNIAAVQPYRGKRNGPNTTPKSPKQIKKKKNRLQKQARKKSRN